MPTCTTCGKDKSDDQFVNAVTGKRAKVCQQCRAVRVRSSRKRLANGKRRDYNYRVAYGISKEDYDIILDSQGGVCAICKTLPGDHSRFKVLVVDHIEGTSDIRGLLCSNCNVGLGMFRHNLGLLEAAMRYLGFRDPADM